VWRLTTATWKMLERSRRAGAQTCAPPLDLLAEGIRIGRAASGSLAASAAVACNGRCSLGDLEAGPRRRTRRKFARFRYGGRARPDNLRSRPHAPPAASPRPAPNEPCCDGCRGPRVVRGVRHTRKARRRSPPRARCSGLEGRAENRPGRRRCLQPGSRGNRLLSPDPRRRVVCLPSSPLTEVAAAVRRRPRLTAPRHRPPSGPLRDAAGRQRPARVTFGRRRRRTTSPRLATALGPDRGGHTVRNALANPPAYETSSTRGDGWLARGGSRRTATTRSRRGNTAPHLHLPPPRSAGQCGWSAPARSRLCRRAGRAKGFTYLAHGLLRNPRPSLTLGASRWSHRGFRENAGPRDRRRESRRR